MPDPKSLLQIDDLRVAFRTPKGMARAVEGVSFDIREREIYALVGESGCGKSTTAHAVMRIINHINAPGHKVSGRAVLAGRDVLTLSEDEMTAVRGKEIGMIFQNPLDSLNPLYTAGYQVYETIVLDKVPKLEAWNRALQLFQDVRISDAPQRLKSFPHELSGGMRQRVMIGMMLSRNPRLLIADEPTTALDVTIQAQILDLIVGLRESRGMAVLVITHDFGIVAEIADRVGVMYAGVMVEEGDVWTIFDDPRHPYTRMLMASLPRKSKRHGRLATIPGTLPDPTGDIPGCRFVDRCPEADERCFKEPPTMAEVAPGHRVACHTPREDKS